MQPGRKTEISRRKFWFVWPAMGGVAACVMALTIIGAAGAVAYSGGLTVETSGVKISLQLSTPDGTKLIFQRAGKPSRQSN